MFLAQENLLFSIAFSLMALFAVSELVSIVLGFQISSVIDSLLPDFDVDISGISSETGSNPILTFLDIKKVPSFIVLIEFLFFFSTLGFALQGVVKSVSGSFLRFPFAPVIAVILTIPFLKLGNIVLLKTLLKSSTSAVSRESFKGQIAEIVLGEARKDSPAEAKFRDSHGQTHYVMVEPDRDEETLTKDEKIILIENKGSYYTAIPFKYE
ncbi:MAG: YqiJ family protein [Spirochaetales bacterium]|nr:YqiJ family protein [Spirochaetales bacterium]